ncbi:MAG: hypothetical protein AAFW59_09125 [Pseudomonadota bacterium]
MIMIVMIVMIVVMVVVVVVIFRGMVWNTIAIMVMIVILGLAGVVILGVDKPCVVRLAPARGQSQNRQRNPNCTHLVSP